MGQRRQSRGAPIFFSKTKYECCVLSTLTDTCTNMSTTLLDTSTALLDLSSTLLDMSITLLDMSTLPDMSTTLLDMSTTLFDVDHVSPATSVENRGGKHSLYGRLHFEVLIKSNAKLPFDFILQLINMMSSAWNSFLQVLSSLNRWPFLTHIRSVIAWCQTNT